MLVDCRRTCGQMFVGEEASSSTVRSQIEDRLVISPQVLRLGGLEDNITDVLGLHQPLCALSQVAASVVFGKTRTRF